MGEEEEDVRWKITRHSFGQELKKEGAIAAPMVVVTLLQYLLQVSVMLMIGHLGPLKLSSVAIATSLTNVTGFSLLSGLAGGLETLCGQAFGAKQYYKVAVYSYSAMISLILVCPLVSVVWIFMYKLLPLLGQDATISNEASRYSMFLIPALFGGAVLKPTTRYFQCQSLILPLLFSSLAVLCIRWPLCWLLIFKLELELAGGAVALGISTWLNVGFLWFYAKHSTTCERTRASFSTEALRSVGKFFRLGVPNAVMVCPKWWSMELLILLAGLFPNPKMEASVLAVCLSISTLHFNIPYALGAAVSTRVSNELGAGRPECARLAAWAGRFLAAVESIIASSSLFFSRSIVGYAYGSQRPFVRHVAAMMPLLCISIITDGLQAVLSGEARGCGWQALGAYINLGAFYAVGLPLGALLGFMGHLRSKGSWLGVVGGSVVQASLLLVVSLFTDWENYAAKAKKRGNEEQHTPQSPIRETDA